MLYISLYSLFKKIMQDIFISMIGVWIECCYSGAIGVDQDDWSQIQMGHILS